MEGPAGIGIVIVIAALAILVLGVLKIIHTESSLDALCEDVGMEHVSIDVEGMTEHVCLDKKTHTFIEINSFNGKRTLQGLSQ